MPFKIYALFAMLALSIYGQPGHARQQGMQPDSPIFKAVDSGDMATVKAMLKDKKRLEEKGFDGETLLSRAISKNNPAMVRLLVKSGADVNEPFHFVAGATPLMGAVIEPNMEIVKFLLAQGAEVDLADNVGWTALFDAASYGYTDMARLLLKRGANVNHQSYRRETALMVASRLGKTEMVQLLLQNHANVNLKNYLEETALSLALTYNYPAIVRLLKKAGAKEAPEPLSRPVTTMDRSVFDCVLDAFVKVKELAATNPRLVDENGTSEAMNLGCLQGAQTVGGRTIPDTMLKRLLARARKPVSLRNYQTRLPVTFISVKDSNAFFAKQTEVFVNRQENPPSEGGAVGGAAFPWIIRLMLPGYSPNGAEAFLIADFDNGGGYSGGTALFYLRRQGQSWKIVWKELYFRQF